VLHLGYAWLGFGFFFLSIDALAPYLPQTAALHALTVGAVGTMILAVMTRATLSRTGRRLTGARTTTIYVLVTLAILCRLLAPLAEVQYSLMLSLAGAAWSLAFGLFAVLYLQPLGFRRRAPGANARPIQSGGRRRRQFRRGRV
jgi:uncharacterized protein involved in response to NO